MLQTPPAALSPRTETVRNDANRTESPGETAEQLATRIRALCVRRGADLGDVANRAGVSRTTLYHILRGRTRRPHVSTLHRIAAALDVAPEQLDADCADAQSRSQSLGPAPDERRRRFDRATNTLVDDVAAGRPQLFAGWSDHDWDELYSTFGTGGQLSSDGVAHAAARINRKRETVHQLQVVLETHLSDVAAEMIGTLFRMVRPATMSAPSSNANNAEPGNQKELNAERRTLNVEH